MTYHTDTTILGGLPVTISWEYASPDRSVGCPGGVDDWYISMVGSRKIKNTSWLSRRIAATKGEEDRIIQALLDDRANWSRDYE